MNDDPHQPERDVAPTEEEAAADAPRGAETGPAKPALETFPPGPGERPAEEAPDAGGQEPPDELERTREQLRLTKEKMLRLAADFDNYRKRARRDQEEAVHKARTDILKEILPVFDNLARAVEHGDSVQDIKPILDGAKMVSRQFEETLARFGLERIEAVGRVFDPAEHEALAQEQTDEVEPGVVLKEFLAGYKLGDRLLRAAMVVVAKAPDGSDDG
jgi:molecular chaperone GrpE